MDVNSIENGPLQGTTYSINLSNNNQNNISVSSVNNSTSQVDNNINQSANLSEAAEVLEDVPDYNVDDVAFDVLQGNYSNGAEREELLTQAGYDYATVQARVNELLPIYLVAYDVINGNYSSGEERKEQLSAAGYNYNEVQNMVNQILNIDVTHPVDNAETTPVIDSTTETTPTVQNNVGESNPVVEEVDIELPETTETTTPNANTESEESVQTETTQADDSIYTDAFIDFAESYIGAGDNPLGYSYQWCLAFVSYCIQNNSAFSDIQGFDLTQTSCSSQVAYINQNNPDAFHLVPGNYNGVETSSYEPKPGDIFFIENNEYDRGQYVVRHVGIVSDVQRDADGNIISITTVEGNVNGSSGAYYNTSEVANKTYLVDDQGRYCLESSSGTAREDFVIYGFFDTAGAVVK